MPSQSDLIGGYPICTGREWHPAENMRIVELERPRNGAQREHWRCPVCRAEFRCQIELGRGIPEELRP